MRYFTFYTIKTTGSNRTGIWYTHISVSETVVTDTGIEYKPCGQFKFRNGASYGDVTEVKNHLAREGYIDSKFGEFGNEDFRYFRWNEAEKFGFDIKRI